MRVRTWAERVASALLAVLLVIATLGGCGTSKTSVATSASGVAREARSDEATSVATSAPVTSGNTDASSDPEKQQAPPATSSASPSAATSEVDEDGSYTSPEEVALYIHTYGHLPSNFISKTKARKAGWVSSEGNLDEVCPGMSIGGSVYYNEGWDGEELLPEAPGRTWTECDVNYHGGYRGSERLVFSNDGLIFYTKDHYQTFTQLY